GKFFIVQARPITSLYPAPRATDGRLHLYASFGARADDDRGDEAARDLGPPNVRAARRPLPAGRRNAAAPPARPDPGSAAGGGRIAGRASHQEHAVALANPTPN